MMNLPEYTTSWALISDKAGEESRYLLVLRDGIPLQVANKRFITLQKGQIRPRTTQIYDFCIFLNYLSSIGKELETATQMDIYMFLSELYIEDDMTYSNLKTYCNAIARIFEQYAILSVPLDESVYREDVRLILIGKARAKTKKSKEYITKVNKLIYLFPPKKKDILMPLYLKWYEDFEIEEIANELALDYRCIFYLTIYTGFRIDSVLSIMMNTVSLKNCSVLPTRTKTGRKHTAFVPRKIMGMLGTYIAEIRNPLALETGFLCNSLFLTQHGKNKGQVISYGAYCRALSVAAEKAKLKDNKISTNVVHSHAGRSTFLSRLRSFQLAERRLNHPTFSDEDLCSLMDWKDLSPLENYDLMTRIQELSPFVGDLMDNIYRVSVQSVEEIG